MDLGLKGKTALVCAASKGLGKGCAVSLAREGVEVTILARGAEALEATAEEIRRETGTKVTSIACDITTPAGREKALAACPSPDILVTNAGGPPPGDFRQWGEAEWLSAVKANMLTPIELIKATIDPMIQRRFGRVINITSGAVKMPIDVLGLSNGARTGLTGFCAGLARQVAQHGVTINNLLPGPFDTDRLRTNTKLAAEKSGKSYDDVWNQRMMQNPSRRFGTVAEFGDACAYLASVQAGFITGQNLLMDGGHFPGTL